MPNHLSVTFSELTIIHSLIMPTHTERTILKQLHNITVLIKNPLSTPSSHHELSVNKLTILAIVHG
jgi:hypothetical protein